MNPKTYNISIPNPCDKYQDWEKMTPTERGKHCAVCEKTVVDFTRMSDAQIARFLRDDQEESCIRAYSTQLNRSLYVMPSPSHFPMAATFITSMLALAMLQPVISQTLSTPVTEQHTVHADSNKPKDKSDTPPDTISVKGAVVDSDTQNPLPFVQVELAGSTIHTQTDLNGRFEINIPNTTNLSTLIFYSIGYRVKKVILSSEQWLTIGTLNVSLTENAVTDVIVISVGKYVGKREDESNSIITTPTESQLKFILNNNR